MGKDLDETERKLQFLYAKQGRQEKYTSKDQRDKHLTKEIKSNKQKLDDVKQSLGKEENSITKINDALGAQEENLETIQGTILKLKEDISGPQPPTTHD